MFEVLSPEALCARVVVAKDRGDELAVLVGRFDAQLLVRAITEAVEAGCGPVAP